MGRHGNADELRSSLEDPKRAVEPLLVGGEVFKRAVQMDGGCADCHQEYDEHPHPGDGETLSCAECHEEALALHPRTRIRAHVRGSIALVIGFACVLGMLVPLLGG